MKKIRFTKKDEAHFMAVGHNAADIPQIKSLKYGFYRGEQKCTFEFVCHKFGREAVLNAISRAAFHRTGSIMGGWGAESNLFD